MKPLRPFPFPLNVGTDICQISRIFGIVSSPRGPRFVNRILAPGEKGRDDVAPSTDKRESLTEDPLHPASGTGPNDLKHRNPELWSRASFIAGRFAAKEAIIKAHSHRKLTFHDIVIERRRRVGPGEVGSASYLGSGPPVARIRAVDEGDADTSAMVSISHDGDYATAVCIAHDPSVMEPEGEA